MDKIAELTAALNLLRTVNVGGDYWLTMHAISNSITQVINALREGEREEDEPINDSADA